MPPCLIDWQNELLESKKRNGQPYTETYLRTVSNQLAVILNHAGQHYGLSPNPMVMAPKIGAREAREVNVWTKEQYLRFSEHLADNAAMFTPIEVLYWTGIRVGELPALMSNDMDFNRCELYVRHSYQRLKGKDTITSPKTEKSNRKISIPEFQRDEIRDYIDNVSHAEYDERIFADIMRWQGWIDTLRQRTASPTQPPTSES